MKSSEESVHLVGCAHRNSDAIVETGACVVSDEDPTCGELRLESLRGELLAQDTAKNKIRVRGIG